jgi:membrane-associated phospholipid phosphatase
MPRNELVRWFVWLAIVVVLCVLFVDRPVAQFAHAHFPNPETFAIPLDSVLLFVPLGAFVLLAGGLVRLGGRPVPRWGMVMMLAAVSLMWALTSNYFLLKPLFGRINIATWLAHPALYGFVPFHGTSHSGFPSGHTIIAASFLTVFWHFYPRVRALIAIILAAVMAGLVLETWHFVSDVVGGLFAGALAARLTVAAIGACVPVRR